MDVLSNANVASELAEMIESYLLNQGRQTMEECTKPDSTYLHLSLSASITLNGIVSWKVVSHTHSSP
jgi:hypothetical protein